MNLKKEKKCENPLLFNTILKYFFIFVLIILGGSYFYNAYTNKRSNSDYLKLDRPIDFISSDFNYSDYAVFKFSKPDSYELFLNKRIKSSDEQIDKIKTNYWNKQKGD